MNRHRGFALYTALILLGILSIVMGLTVELIKTDAFRTRDELGIVQMQQLLISGQAVVADQLASGGVVTDQRLPLPPELGEAQLSIHPGTVGPESVRVQIDANIGPRHAGQLLVYGQSNNHWKLIEATMD